MHNNKKLRVGYVSPGWPLSSYPSGIVAYVDNIISGLDDSVKSIILSFGIDEPEIEDFTVDIEKYNNYSNLPQEFLLKFLLKFKYSNADLMQYKHFLRGSEYIYKYALEKLKEPLDILEVEESFGAIYYAINQSETRYVTRLHGPWFIMEKLHNLAATEHSKLRIFYEGEAIKNSHGVTAPSIDVLEKVREYYNLELPYAKVIPNPVQLVSKDKQWRLTEEKPYILFVGRFDVVKGGDLIIDSFNIIAQTDKNITLCVVGPDRGIVVDGVQLNVNEYILKKISDESIRKRIKYTGSLNPERVLMMRKEARVTVCCSRYETFGLSLLEALAVGCPTVVTAVGGMKEIIVDDYNGLFAETESPDSIAEKVLCLLNDNEKSALLSKQAIEDSNKRFSTKEIAEQSVDYYKSVLDRY